MNNFTAAVKIIFISQFCNPAKHARNLRNDKKNKEARNKNTQTERKWKNNRIFQGVWNFSKNLSPNVNLCFPKLKFGVGKQNLLKEIGKRRNKE